MSIDRQFCFIHDVEKDDCEECKEANSYFNKQVLLGSNLKFRKARKDHNCHLCGGKIKAGDKYFAKEEKDTNFNIFREHVSCF